MNQKVCTLCGRTGHRAASCPQTGKNIGTAAKFVRCSSGALKEVRPGFTPGLNVLRKSAPWLGLGEIAPSSGQGATVESGVIGDE